MNMIEKVAQAIYDRMNEGDVNTLIATTFVVFNCDISATQMNAVQRGAGALFLGAVFGDFQLG